MKTRSVAAVCLAAVLLFGAGSLPGAPETAGPPLRYEIWVELDHAQRMLHGREVISWTNTSRDAVPDMLFHLYYNAFKNENSTVMQESKAEGMFIRARVKDGDWGWIDVPKIELAGGPDLKPTMEFVTRDEPRHPGDQTVMRVTFPEPVPPGGSVRLKLEFESKVPRNGMRTGRYKDSYFISQWFPKPGVYEEGKGWNCHEYHMNSEFFADFADFIVHITVPNNFVVGSSGKLIDSLPNAVKKTITHTYAQTRIHDFAWTASPGFIKVEREFIADQEVTPQEYEETARQFGLPLEDVRLPNVKMTLLIEKQHRSQIDRHFKALRMALKYYGLWYGPYPYETVTMVDPPFRTGSGGMEYPTLFTAGTSVLKSRKVLSPEGVIVHEFGHGYWYGLSANNEFEEAWLDEGINTYSTGKVVAKAYGPGELGASFKGIPLGWFLKLPESTDSESDRAAAINIVEVDPVVTPSWKFYNGGSYALNVYERASTCLNTLERLLGAEVMARVMRTFHTRFRFKHPATQDFIAVVNEVSGKDMAWFFEQMFFNTLNFDYGIASVRSVEKPLRVRGVFDVGGIKKET
ncbi:MAG: M1 family metallopeptidase, partial [Candidatus Aminicenantes bacterium]|nr:M1 family metallopeptidase [Candidatus Aminicenantes bacterium]